jgi:hypothetical protein
VPADPPSEVQITVDVVPNERARWVRERLPRLALVASALAVLAVVVALVGGGSGGSRARDATPAEVAAAFGYPLRCLKVTIAGRFAHARVNRASGCWRFRGYLDASFQLIDGRWRLILDEGQLFVRNALPVGTR